MTATQTHPNYSVSYFMSARGDERIEETDHGTHIVHGIKVFRVGSFKDSKGRDTSWDQTDLDKMAANYDHLRGAGIFPNVPVKADHGPSVNNVVGYFAAVRREGDFLVADVEFTEPEAFEKWQRGTFRARSLEVVPYEDNSGTVHYPVAMGLAFVDVGAVEGLQFNKEPSVPEQTKHEFKINGVPTSDYATVQSRIDELEAKIASPPEPHAFRIQGTEEKDPAKVQAHVDVLEGTLKDVAELGRSEFVTSLAENNKIPATQVEPLTAFVKSLTPEQFTAYRAQFDGAGTAPVLGKFGTQITEPTKVIASEKEVLEGQVNQFRLMGMAADQIEKTSAFKKLAVLNAA